MSDRRDVAERIVNWPALWRAITKPRISVLQFYVIVMLSAVINHVLGLT